MGNRCAAVCVLAGLLLVPSALPAAGGEAAAGPDAQVSAARAKAAAARLKAMTAAREAFLRVVLTPRWDEARALEAAAAQVKAGDRLWGEHWHTPMADRAGYLLELHAEKRTEEMFGVLLAGGLVAVPDDGTAYDWRLVAKVEAFDAAGRKWTAKPYGHALRAAALVFKLEGEGLPAGVQFRQGAELSLEAPLMQVRLARDSRYRGRLRLESSGTAVPYDAAPVSADRLRLAVSAPAAMDMEPAGAALICDETGAPVGATFGDEDLSNENRSAWEPKAMLAALVPEERVAKVRSAAEAEALRICHRVRFEFRVPPPDEEEEDLARGRWFDAENAADAEGFGISLGGGRLLVPRALQPEILRQVDKIAVRVGREWKPAKFVGSFRKYEAMLIEVEGMKLAEPAGLAETKGVGEDQLFICCRLSECGGRPEAKASSARIVGTRQGYADRFWPDAPGVPVGALLFSMEGRFAGVSLLERRERRLADMAEHPAMRMGPDVEMMDLVGFDRLKVLLADPAKHAEPGWRPMTREEELKLVWLGVEFDPVTPELAEQLDVQEPTRGGLVGLLVTTVYAGSPAATMGLAAKDILLRLEVEGLGDPLPLSGFLASEEADMMGLEGFGGPDMGPDAGRSWRPRLNQLTRVLTEAGPGRKASVTYYGHKDRRVQTGRFDLAYAPPDYDSAPKHKDEKLGMAVRPVTYEVRAALGLKPDDPGVVISWVEEGGSAQLARLTPYMLVTHVEGQAVKSTGDFKAAIEKIRKEQKRTVKLQVSAMGKSRFADLKVEE